MLDALARMDLTDEQKADRLVISDRLRNGLRTKQCFVKAVWQDANFSGHSFAGMFPHGLRCEFAAGEDDICQFIFHLVSLDLIPGDGANGRQEPIRELLPNNRNGRIVAAGVSNRAIENRRAPMALRGFEYGM